MGERMRPVEFHAFLDHFYRLASSAILEHAGLVDKIVGDEVIGLFFGGVSGPEHAAAAIAAALDLAERASRPSATPSGPIPAGTAVHTGDAFVGATGPIGAVDDFTALGDAVNTTARLASAARAGEVLVSVAAATASGTPTDGLERRTLEIREGPSRSRWSSCAPATARPSRRSRHGGPTGVPNVPRASLKAIVIARAK